MDKFGESDHAPAAATLATCVPRPRTAKINESLECQVNRDMSGAFFFLNSSYAESIFATFLSPFFWQTTQTLLFFFAVCDAGTQKNKCGRGRMLLQYIQALAGPAVEGLSCCQRMPDAFWQIWDAWQAVDDTSRATPKAFLS